MPRDLRLLIVDDEPLAHDLLEKYCSRVSYLKVMGHCYDSLSTLSFLNDNQVDAILLDIQLPDLTGIELLETLENRAPKIIFTTAYTEYAAQSFDFDQVIDYLNKPIRLPRFIKAIERLRHQLQLEENLNSASSLEIPDAVIKNHLLIKEDKITHRVDLKDVTHVQSWGNYLKFFTKDGKVRLARKTISEIEDEISDSGFVRIHKSYLINKQFVSALDGNRVVLNDQKFPIGRSYKLYALQKLMN